MLDKKTVDEVKGRLALGAKLLVIGVILVVLLVLKGMVSDLVHEREETRAGAIKEIASKWGDEQVVAGPVLVVPYLEREKVEEDDGKRVRTIVHTRYATFLPESLDVAGKLKPEIRYRGIYQAVLYNVNLALKGTFAKPDFKALRISEADVQWGDAVLSLGIDDPRGLTGQANISWNKRPLRFAPGGGDGSFVHSGIQVKGLPLGAATMSYDIDLSLNGSQSLSFLPLGRQTSVSLDSPWKAPGFTGDYLPATRQIGESGFKADWKVLELARKFSQQWLNSSVPADALYNSGFGVEMVIPAGAYQQSERSIKYAFLFIVLTFTAFFLFEIQGGLKVHPLQYLLVGCSLVVFYLLLLSLSEHVGYNAAYGLATLAVLVTIGGYCRAILAGNRRAGLIVGLLAWLYAYLFVVLRLEDYALLMGSLLVFASLAAVMWFTRKVDWYGIAKKP